MIRAAAEGRSVFARGQRWVMWGSSWVQNLKETMAKKGVEFAPDKAAASG
jgi:hypothetical protein